jgi:hypothetical protein
MGRTAPGECLLRKDEGGGARLLACDHVEEELMDAEVVA